MGRIRTIILLCLAFISLACWIFAQPITLSGLEWQNRRCTNNLVPSGTNFYCYVEGADGGTIQTNANGLFFGGTNFGGVYYPPSANGFPTIYTNDNPIGYTVEYIAENGANTNYWQIDGLYATASFQANPPESNLVWVLQGGGLPPPPTTTFSNTVTYSTNGVICR